MRCERATTRRASGSPAYKQYRSLTASVPADLVSDLRRGVEIADALCALPRPDGTGVKAACTEIGRPDR